jgi:tRNA pseudouridine55 synthase
MSAQPAVNGVLVVDKPLGPTSHDVVARARRALGTPRVGHTGTLDPQATGVLPLVVGKATRLAQFLSASVKEYDALVAFGRATDTYDAAGAVTEETGRQPSAEAVEAALERFRGAFLQAPPAYSAKKVDGERAYARARRAEAVTPAPVAVTVERLELTGWDGDLVCLRVRASAGFYVRSLAHDLGAALGTGAHLAGLRRILAGAFTLDDAVPFEHAGARAPRVAPAAGCDRSSRCCPTCRPSGSRSGACGGPATARMWGRPTSRGRRRRPATSSFLVRTERSWRWPPRQPSPAFCIRPWFCANMKSLLASAR